MQIGSSRFSWACVAAIVWALAAGSAEAAPKEGKYGFWHESYRGFNYTVDVVAQLCFAVAIPSPGSAGVAPVPCENLAKREEWKPILTWVEEPQSGPSEPSSR